MPTFDAQQKAAELERQLATLTGHDLAHVKPYGKHLLIQMHRDGNVDTIARLTETGRNVSPQPFAAIPAARNPCLAPEILQRSLTWRSLCWQLILILIIKATGCCTNV